MGESGKERRPAVGGEDAVVAGARPHLMGGVGQAGGDAVAHLGVEDVVGVAVEDHGRLLDAVDLEAPVEEGPHVVEGADAALLEGGEELGFEHGLERRVREDLLVAGPGRGAVRHEAGDVLRVVLGLDLAGRHRDELGVGQREDELEVAVLDHALGALLVEGGQGSGQADLGDAVAEHADGSQRVWAAARVSRHHEAAQAEVVGQGGEVVDVAEQRAVLLVGGAPAPGRSGLMSRRPNPAAMPSSGCLQSRESPVPCR